MERYSAADNTSIIVYVTAAPIYHRIKVIKVTMYNINNNIYHII